MTQLQRRLRICRLIEKAQRYPDFSKQIGLTINPTYSQTKKGDKK